MQYSLNFGTGLIACFEDQNFFHLIIVPILSSSISTLPFFSHEQFKHEFCFNFNVLHSDTWVLNDKLK